MEMEMKIESELISAWAVVVDFCCARRERQVYAYGLGRDPALSIGAWGCWWSGSCRRVIGRIGASYTSHCGRALGQLGREEGKSGFVGGEYVQRGVVGKGRFASRSSSSGVQWLPPGIGETKKQLRDLINVRNGSMRHRLSRGFSHSLAGCVVKD
jgi:hypothetical protein